MFEDAVPIKPRPDGKYTFFSNGIFSKKGYILTQNEANWVRNFISAYYSVAMAVVTTGIFVFHIYITTIILCFLTTLLYEIIIHKFIKNKPQVNERISASENIKKISKKTFVLIILATFGLIFFIILDIIIIVAIDKKFTFENASFLLFLLILFGLFVCFLKIKLGEFRSSGDSAPSNSGDTIHNSS